MPQCPDTPRPEVPPHDDYHDYVIKNGRFVGAFEPMYQRCADPWHQLTDFPLANQLALWLIQQEPARRIFDIGCGLGAFTRRLRDATGAALVAADISSTALRRARTAVEGAWFLAMDARAVAVAKNRFDLVVASELLWYVLPDVRRVLEDLLALLTPGGRLCVIQQFYQPGKQQYGADVMARPEDMLKYLPCPAEHFIVVDPHLDPKCVLITRRP